MIPIRKQRAKANKSLRLGVDYKDLAAGSTFEQFVRDNNATIWHNPERVKQEIARNEAALGEEPDAALRNKEEGN